MNTILACLFIIAVSVAACLADELKYTKRRLHNIERDNFELMFFGLKNKQGGKGMLHDAKIEKPPVDEREGVSDPVNVFTDNGMILVAWYDGSKWWDLEGFTDKEVCKDWFGNVLWWSEIKLPSGWFYDSDIYK